MNATTLPVLEPLLDATEVAKVLKMSRKFVYRLHRTGELPSVQLGAAVRFRPADVRAYVERLARPAATVTPLRGRETIPAPAGEG